ncbi:hypothetical protein N6L24_06380 [Cognatishimia sp. SS12]|uniref:hypothetical protein n=1 Tax=Cognatishimia sp. SS12 TaxID=2979465 RepID=UPI00232D1079|nr:hypothetical protein [Cognatishimia sp. SS12]MDC0737897.1 hypothetical protein [Cognatishimia sp. SS12]
MSRKFITSILIAAVTVTGISLSAAPARAGNDDLAKLLFGATALIIIGKAVSNNRAEASTRNAPIYVNPRDERWRRDGQHRADQNRDQRHRNRALPASCLRTYHTRDGRVRMMSKYCLDRSYRHADRLPQACKTRVRTENGPRRGYQLRCLRHNGYRLASN